MAYDPTTGQAKAEPVEHVFINHDTNPLDVTLAPFTTTTTPATQDDAISPNEARAAIASHGTRAPPTNQPEMLHTTTEHPFLTTDRGFVDAVKLQVGEHIQRMGGGVAVVVTPGAAVRYNLTVRALHTFAVGAGQWVVHNCGNGSDRIPGTSQHRPCVDPSQLVTTAVNGQLLVHPNILYYVGQGIPEMVLLLEAYPDRIAAIPLSTFLEITFQVMFIPIMLGHIE